MALEPPYASWVQEDDSDFDSYSHLIPTSGRESPHENQHILPGEAVQSTRPAYIFDNIEALSSYDPPVDYSRSYDSMPPAYSQGPSVESSLSTRSEDKARCGKIPRSVSYKGVPSSSLNPAVPSGPQILSPFSSPGSRGSPPIMRIPSEDSRALSSGSPSSTNPMHTGGSMILYRRAETQHDLFPPQLSHAKPNPMLSSDSKYPGGTMISEHGLVAYAWDPLMDEPMDEEDRLHDLDGKMTYGPERMSLRGLINIAALILLLSALLSLFVMYPVYQYYHDNGRNALIVGNTRINSTGQASSVDFDPRNQIPLVPLSVGIDPATPQEALTRRSKDGISYRLVFSDEFNTDGRSFYNDDDPFWEAMDDRVHDHRLVTTQKGYLLLKSRIVPVMGSLGAPTRGFLKQRTSTCLDGGFIEISVASLTSPIDRRVIWTGSWISGDAEVPIKGSSLSEIIPVQLSLDPGNAGPTDTLAIDFVRYYQRVTSPLQSCDKTQPQTLKFSRHYL